MELTLTDGRQIRAAHTDKADVVVVGSGPGGAAAARVLAREGAKVLVVEAGLHVRPEEFRADGFRSMAQLYRDMGANVSFGNLPMPVVQAMAVGGTSVVNGAISWRLPRDVHQRWVEADPGLAEGLPWQALDTATDTMVADLNIHPTRPEVAGRHNELLAAGAEALGLEHRAISRNVRGCEGLGRCLQGCPRGHKQSMDRSLLPEACRHGARILAGVHVDGIEVKGGRAVGVVGTARGGGGVRIEADRVVVAAGAVHSPELLRRSRIRGGPLGREFSCHPGVSVAGTFPDPVNLWTGATQGHEVIGLRHEGLKFEALGYDLAIAAARLDGIGRGFAIDELAHQAQWGAAIKASGRGRVWRGKVFFSLTADDVRKVRRAVFVLGELLFAAGARHVSPGVYGWDKKVTDRAAWARFETEGPLSPSAYTMAATHLFGTCRMGSDPTTSVVRPGDLRHHRVDGLHVVDASAFPSNTGVNPQTSILAIAHVAAERMAA